MPITAQNTASCVTRGLVRAQILGDTMGGFVHGGLAGHFCGLARTNGRGQRWTARAQAKPLRSSTGSCSLTWSPATAGAKPRRHCAARRSASGQAEEDRRRRRYRNCTAMTSTTAMLRASGRNRGAVRACHAAYPNTSTSTAAKLRWTQWMAVSAGHRDVMTGGGFAQFAPQREAVFKIHVGHQRTVTQRKIAAGQRGVVGADPAAQRDLHRQHATAPRTYGQRGDCTRTIRPPC